MAIMIMVKASVTITSIRVKAERGLWFVAERIIGTIT
jgi:hypothetical protein